MISVMMATMICMTVVMLVAVLKRAGIVPEVPQPKMISATRSVETE